MIRAAMIALALTAPAAAQQQPDFPAFEGVIERISAHAGRMTMEMPGVTPDEALVTEAIRFEPWQMLDDLFRDDIVFLMRSGPSDWAVPEAAEAGGDCVGTSLLTEEGADRMRQFGMLLVVNEVAPGEMLVSSRCRAQQTYLALETGLTAAEMDALDGVSVDVLPDAESGAEALRAAVMDWDGGDGDGPLLIVSDFDAIEGLTRFRTYEGEILILDPTRGGRVLGYLRLASAVPDALRFPADVVEFALRQEAAE